MSSPPSCAPLRWFLLVISCGILCAAEPVREWTSTDGRKLSASLLGVDGDSVVLRTKDGNRVVIPTNQLQEGDQSLLRLWQRGRSAHLALPPVAWVAEIQPGPVTVRGPSVTDAGWEFLTQHYRLISDAELSTSAIQELATAGEATQRWLASWPLRMPPTETGQLAIARILRTREAYEAAGAPPDSGGFFRNFRDGPGELLVPFESLGLETSPNSAVYRKGQAFSTRTLIHEMAHQQMAPVLRYMPLFMSEGLAELAALPEYRAGKFQVTRQAMITRMKQRWEEFLKRDPTTGAELTTRAAAQDWTIPLETLFTLDERSGVWKQATLAEKHRTYLTSLLVAFYFMYLDDDSQARRLRIYWHDLLQAERYLNTDGQSGSLPPAADRPHDLRQALLTHLLAGQSIPNLQADLTKRFNAANIRIAFRERP